MTEVILQLKTELVCEFKKKSDFEFKDQECCARPQNCITNDVEEMMFEERFYTNNIGTCRRIRAKSFHFF